MTLTDLIEDWRQRAQLCREQAGRLGHNEYAAMWNRQKAEILTECANELAAYQNNRPTVGRV